MTNETQIAERARDRYKELLSEAASYRTTNYKCTDRLEENSLTLHGRELKENIRLLEGVLGDEEVRALGGPISRT
ncbi:MAG: hypothetical protein ABH864_01205 [archaeon]